MIARMPTVLYRTLRPLALWADEHTEWFWATVTHDYMCELPCRSLLWPYPIDELHRYV